MEIREFRDGDVLVIAPDGSLSGSEETSALETKIGAALKAGTLLMVLDCAGVGQITGAAIRPLLQASRKLGRAQGRLVLCGMNAKVKKAFSISGFDRDFTVVATREEALQRVLEPAGSAPARPAKPVSAEEPAVAEAPSPTEAVAETPTEAPPAVEPQSALPALAPPPAVPVPAPPPAAPDPREALAAALLEALGARGRHPAPTRPDGASPPDLEAVASGVLAALRARVP